MPKVKMLQQTYYDKNLVEDEIVDVNQKTADRWIRIGLAEAVESDEQLDPAEGDEGGKEQSGEPSPYDGMKAKDLYDACVARGIEAEPKKAVPYYVELLTAADEAAKAAE